MNKYFKPFSNKCFTNGSAIILHFCQLFNIWLKRRQLDFHICFCIQYVEMLFWLKYKEKSGLRYIVERRRCILVAFSNNYGYSPLILCQNSARTSFLKVSYSVESETISMNLYTCERKMRVRKAYNILIL